MRYAILALDIILLQFVTASVDVSVLLGLTQQLQLGLFDIRTGGFKEIGGTVGDYYPTEELSSIDIKMGAGVSLSCNAFDPVCHLYLGRSPLLLFLQGSTTRLVSTAATSVFIETVFLVLIATTASAVVSFAVYDPARKVPLLLGIDTSSGDVRVNITLPFVESSYVGGGEQIDVDPSTGDVLVGGRLAIRGPHVIGRLQPLTGEFSKVAEIGANYTAVLAGRSAYDSIHGKLVLQLGAENPARVFDFVVDVHTGAASRVQEGPGQSIATLAFNPKDGLMYGLALETARNGSFERILRTFNTTSMQFKDVCTIPGFVDESGGETALNPASGQLSWISMDPNGGPSSPHVLVTTDIKTCETVHSAPLQDAYPWSIEYLVGGLHE